MQILHQDFKNRINEITDLSNKINKNNNQKIMEMMKEHIKEIEERYLNNDDHWAIEVCDQVKIQILLALKRGDSYRAIQSKIHYKGKYSRLYHPSVETIACIANQCSKKV